jgi:hypothetical protein
LAARVLHAAGGRDSFRSASASSAKPLREEPAAFRVLRIGNPEEPRQPERRNRERTDRSMM